MRLENSVPFGKLEIHKNRNFVVAKIINRNSYKKEQEKTHHLFIHYIPPLSMDSFYKEK